MPSADANRGSSGSRGKRTLAVWVRHDRFASRFAPVDLRPEEQEVLGAKQALLRKGGSLQITRNDQGPVP